MSLSKYSKKVWIPDVGSKPHQPLVNFKFPYRQYREFGKQKLVKRAFQHSWFAKWKWLHYEEDMDKAFCYNCIQAYKEDKLRASNLELAFISKGFNSWKDASVKFKEHESSNCHKDSMIVTVDLPSSVKDIAETLQRELTKKSCLSCCRRASFKALKCPNSRSFRGLRPLGPHQGSALDPLGGLQRPPAIFLVPMAAPLPKCFRRA